VCNNKQIMKKPSSTILILKEWRIVWTKLKNEKTIVVMKKMTNKCKLILCVSEERKPDQLMNNQYWPNGRKTMWKRTMWQMKLWYSLCVVVIFNTLWKAENVLIWNMYYWRRRRSDWRNELNSRWPSNKGVTNDIGQPNDSPYYCLCGLD